MYLCAPMSAVSVIIPVYKVEPYVARCARSLFNQTLEDIEYIFVDDCTPDRSIEIVKEVLADYPKRKEQVQFVRTPRNGGLARARVFGLQHAKGDYIIHCDSDDAVERDAYCLMYNEATANNYDVVTCRITFRGLNRTKVFFQRSKEGREVGDILLGKALGYVWCRMFKRGLWDDIIPPQGDMWEDMVFSIQAMSKARRFGYVQDAGYIYYRRGDSISYTEGRHAAIKRWESARDNAQIVIGFLENNPSVNRTEEDIVYFKYRTRDHLTPYIQSRDIYHKWRSTFPEIDSVLLKTRGIPLNIKIWFILIHLHLFYVCKTVTRFIRSNYQKLLV